MSHRLAIHPSVRPVAQRKQKVGKLKRITIDEEVENLYIIGFITKTRYPTWLANMVLVIKADKKWNMCVDFTNLNAACPKDPYLLPDINHPIGRSSGYWVLSFMNAYSGYNQIKMDQLDAPKTAFMSN